MKTFGDKKTKEEYHERPGAYGIIINSKQELAVIKLPSGYFLPGGGTDEGETSEVALEREVMEETGHAVKVNEYVGKSGQYYFSKFKKKHIFKTGEFYACKIGDALKEAAKDHELIWLKPEEAIKNLNHDFQKWAVREAFLKLLKKNV